MKEKQLEIEFGEPPVYDYKRPSPAEMQRKERACIVLGKTDSPVIKQLIETNQVTTAACIESQGIEIFVRDNRISLTKFVQLMANAGYARSQKEHEQAWGLLNKINQLGDLELALELESLGLCESTESFGRKIGSYRYLLFKFRRAMKKWRETTPQPPPSPAQ